MFLTLRPTVVADLVEAFTFVKKRFQIPAADCADLQKMWAQILREAECYCTVIEDTDRREGERIVSLILTYCVPDPVMDFARTQAPPFLWRWTLERWRQGHPVWLQKGEAHQAQLEGHVAVFAHMAADVYRYSGADLGMITNTHSAGSTRDLMGQKVRYYVTEVYDQGMRERFLSHGFAVLSDYRQFQADPAWQALPEALKPCLLIADLHKAAEDRRIQNTSVGRAALAVPPRYGFSRSEQEVMKIALTGLTDQAIADKLALSLITIKKRWEGIYEKVKERSYAQDWEKDGSSGSEAKIGRRQVLQLMAEHPEEFRPSLSKKKAAK